MERIIEYDALWVSAMKCKCGVSWKPSVKHYVLNAVEETHMMEDKLKSGEWKNGRPREIMIRYPKKREGLSIPIKDRIYQRSINDNVLYPALARGFILDNCACQKGKGPDFARKRLKKHLRNHISHYGNGGYVLQIDIKGYYPNMRHDAVKAKFKRYLPTDVYEAVCNVLDTQYVGDIGYNPGSQMVQIAGISLLDDLDHFCKERLHARHYIRYMDDILIVHDDEKVLTEILESVENELAELGFEYKVTSTGKIIMTLNSANIKHERKKLRRLVSLVKQGRITKAKADECFRDWKVNASKGNSYKLLERMDRFYKELWEEEYVRGKTKDVCS